MGGLNVLLKSLRYYRRLRDRHQERGRRYRPRSHPVSDKPTTNLTKFINSLKGVTSRRVRTEFPEVTQTLEDAFWQPGYFLATTGQVSIDVLMDYVDDQ